MSCDSINSINSIQLIQIVFQTCVTDIITYFHCERMINTVTRRRASFGGGGKAYARAVDASGQRDERADKLTCGNDAHRLMTECFGHN